MGSCIPGIHRADSSGRPTNEVLSTVTASLAGLFVCSRSIRYQRSSQPVSSVASVTHAGNVDYQLKPYSCFATKHFKVGELKLVPAVELGRFQCVEE